MLYPPHYTVFPEGSNLRRFYDRFTILSQKETDLHANLWRVFHTTETNISRLTATNSLQRNLLSYLQAGNRMGTGLGVILYDPEKQ